MFGCYASVVIARELRKSKFQSIVNEGIIIGYSRVRKAHRVLLKDGTITETREVVFDEKLFPGTSAISGFANDVFHQTGLSGGGSRFTPLPADILCRTLLILMVHLLDLIQAPYLSFSGQRFRSHG